MIRINQKSTKRKQEDSLRVALLKKQEDAKQKKRNALVQDMLVQRIISTNERKLERTLAKEKIDKSMY